jgi:hypothetical protein
MMNREERPKKIFHKEKRRKLCVTLPSNYYVWLCMRTSDGTFYNISHGIEMCIKLGRKHYVKTEEQVQS